MNKTNDDKIAHASKAPNVRALVDEFRRCAPTAGYGWNRAALNDDVRWTRWPGQHADGKKHGSDGKEAFPFDGASDVRIPLADDLINDLVAEDWEAFWRAWLPAKFGATEESQYALKLADHFVNTQLYAELHTAVELSSQYRNQYGWVALQPMWVQEVSLEEKEITIDDVVREVAQRADMPALAELPKMIADPTLEEPAMEAFRFLHAEYAAGLAARVKTFRPPALETSEVRRMVRELREDWRTTVPLPFIAKDGPAVVVRKPWDEVFITGDTADLQQRRVFIRTWEDEVSLMEKKLTHGWNETWIKEALKHKGKHSTWTSDPIQTELAQAMAREQSVNYAVQDQKDNMVEVIYAMYRALNKSGVPGVYMTVFNPHVLGDTLPGGHQEEEGSKEGTYAWHGLIAGARGRIPLIIGTRERVAANFASSRGVPEVAVSWQRQKKVQHDGLTDWTSIGVFPPVNVIADSSYGVAYRFGPGVRNTVKPGKEPKFMEVPSRGVPVSFELMQEVDNAANKYFGRPTKDMPQGNTSKKQKAVGSFLLMWAEAVQELVCQAMKYMPDEQFAQITGAPLKWLEQNRNAYLISGLKLQFDVRELDPEFVLKQMDVVNKAILPADVTGALDRNKWTQYQMRTINPALARELASNQGEASQRLYAQVMNDLALMFLGNEPQYVEMDPAAQAKLQYANQIVAGNTNYQQALQNPQSRFALLVKNYVMNLQFSLKQEENKKIGRIGVQPEEGGAGAAAGGGMEMMPMQGQQGMQMMR